MKFTMPLELFSMIGFIHALQYSGFHRPLIANKSASQLSYLKMTSDVRGTFDAIFSKIEADQEFRESDHSESMGLDTWTANGKTGLLKGFLGSKLDWCSKLVVNGADDEELFSLACWTFPMYDIPHLSITLEKKGGDLYLNADLIPKEDLMYSQDYLENFYGGGTLAWYNNLIESPLSASLPVSNLLRGRVLSSPAHVNIRLSDTPESFLLMTDGVHTLVDTWLGWLSESTEIPRVRRGTMLSRDSILRRMSFAVNSRNPIFGDQGQEIAIAMAGPGDQAYIGQAS